MNKHSVSIFRTLALVGVMASLTACEPEDFTSGSHPTAVDLGLNIKWASCNVGANMPYEYGSLYSWGELDPTGEIILNITYEHLNISASELLNDYATSFFMDNSIYKHIGTDIKWSQYDVAHVEWGENWRMPTQDEVNELLTKCSWEKHVVNDVHGMKVTGPNGNSIFLPWKKRHGASGFYSYWSSTLSEDEHSAYAYEASGTHNSPDSEAFPLCRIMAALVRPVMNSFIVTEPVNSTNHR